MLMQAGKDKKDPNDPKDFGKVSEPSKKGRKPKKNKNKADDDFQQNSLSEQFMRFNKPGNEFKREKPRKERKLQKKLQKELQKLSQSQDDSQYKNQRAKVFSYSGRQDQYKNSCFRCQCGKVLSSRTVHKCQILSTIKDNEGASGKSCGKYCIQCFQKVRGNNHVCQGTNRNINLALMQNKQFGLKTQKQLMKIQSDVQYSLKAQYLRILMEDKQDFDSKLFVQSMQKKQIIGQFILSWRQLQQGLCIPNNRNQLINLMGAIVYHCLAKKKIHINQLLKFTFPGFRNFFYKIPYNDIFTCMGEVYYSTWKIDKQVVNLLKKYGKFEKQVKILEKYSGKLISEIELYNQFQKINLNLKAIQFMFVKSVAFVLPDAERLTKIIQLYIPKDLQKKIRQRQVAVRYHEADNQLNFNTGKTISTIYYKIKEAVDQSIKQGNEKTGQQNFYESYSMPYDMIQAYLRNQQPKEQVKPQQNILQKYKQLASYLQQDLKKIQFYQDLKYFRTHKKFEGFKNKQFWQKMISDYDTVALDSQFIENNLFFQKKQQKTKEITELISDTFYNEMMYSYILHKQMVRLKLMSRIEKRKIMKYFTLQFLQQIYNQEVFCQVQHPIKIYKDGHPKNIYLTYKQFIQRAFEQQFIIKVDQNHDLYRIDSNLVSTFKQIKDYRRSTCTLYSFSNFDSKIKQNEVQFIQLKKITDKERKFREYLYKINKVSQGQVYKTYIKKIKDRHGDQGMLLTILAYFLRTSQQNTWFQVKQKLCLFQNNYLLDLKIDWYQVLLDSKQTKKSQKDIFNTKIRQFVNEDKKQKEKEYKKQISPFVFTSPPKNTGQWLSSQTMQLLPSQKRLNLVLTQSNKIKVQFSNIWNNYYKQFEQYLTDKNNKARDILVVQKSSKQLLFQLWDKKYANNLINRFVLKKQEEINNKLLDQQLQNFLSRYPIGRLRSKLCRYVQDVIIRDIHMRIITIQQFKAIIDNKNICQQMIKFASIGEVGSIFQDQALCVGYLQQIFNKKQLQTTMMYQNHHQIVQYWDKIKKPSEILLEVLKTQYGATRFALIIQHHYIMHTGKYQQIFNIEKLVQYYKESINFDQPLKQIKQLFSDEYQNQVNLILEQQPKDQLKKIPAITLFQAKLKKHTQMVLSQTQHLYWKVIQKQRLAQNITGGGRKKKIQSQSQQYSMSQDERQYRILLRIIGKDNNKKSKKLRFQLEEQQQQQPETKFCKWCKKNHTQLQYETQGFARNQINKNRVMANKIRLQNNQKCLNYIMLGRNHVWRQIQKKNIENIQYSMISNRVYIQRIQNKNPNKRIIYHKNDGIQQQSQNVILFDLPSCQTITACINLAEQPLPWQNVQQRQINKLLDQKQLIAINSRKYKYEQQQRFVSQRFQTLQKQLEIQIKNRFNTQKQESIIDIPDVSQVENSQFGYNIPNQWGDQNMIDRNYFIKIDSISAIEIDEQHYSQKAQFQNVIQLDEHIEKYIEKQNMEEVIQISQDYDSALIAFTKYHNCSRCGNRFTQKTDHDGVKRYFRCRNSKCQNSSYLKYKNASYIQNPMVLQFKCKNSQQQMMNNDDLCSEAMQMKIHLGENSNNLLDYIQNPSNDWQFSRQVFARGYLTTLNLFTKTKILKRKNRQVISQYFNKLNLLPIEIKKCKDQKKGLGVFATQSLQQNTIVAIYTGQAYVDFQCPLHIKNDSVLRVGWLMLQQEKLDYQILLYPNQHRDLGRYLNSSQKPNCIGFWGMYGNKPLYILKTSKKVKKGVQLCWDYGIFGEVFQK